MKILPIHICLATFVISLSFKDSGVLGQYSPQIIRTDGDGDDLGLLLTVLLLASKNKGSNCGCCCGSNIPVPYPIPIPTNNPIIRTSYRGYDDDYEDDDGSTSNSYSSATGGRGGEGGNALSEPEQNVYILTSNDNEALSELQGTANANADSNADSNANSNSDAKSKIKPSQSRSSRGVKKNKSR